MIGDMILIVNILLMVCLMMYSMKVYPRFSELFGLNSGSETFKCIAQK